MVFTRIVFQISCIIHNIHVTNKKSSFKQRKERRRYERLFDRYHEMRQLFWTVIKRPREVRILDEIRCSQKKYCQGKSNYHSRSWDLYPIKRTAQEKDRVNTRLISCA